MKAAERRNLSRSPRGEPVANVPIEGLDQPNFIERGFVYYQDSDEKIRRKPIWIDPEIGDPILVIHERWAYKVANGEKTLEIRSNFLRKIKPQDRIWIAVAQENKGRKRAYPAIFPEHEPKNSRIIGSVVFDHQEWIYPDAFNSFFDQHLIPPSDEMAPDGGTLDKKYRGWFFTNAVRAPREREYIIKSGAMTRRVFHGWLD